MRLCNFKFKFLQCQGLPQDIRIKTKPGPGLERKFKFYGLFCIALPALDRTSSSENGVRLRGRLLSSVL